MMMTLEELIAQLHKLPPEVMSRRVKLEVFDNFDHDPSIEDEVLLLAEKPQIEGDHVGLKGEIIH